MTTSFADYVSTQGQHQDMCDVITKYTHLLIEALKDNYRKYVIRSHQRAIENLNYTYETTDSIQSQYYQNEIDKLRSGKCSLDYIVETGRKYYKVVMTDSSGSRSVHCFIDKNTGGVFKPASWKSPAKGERFDLLNDEHREWMFENADWAGSWLYKS
jgi:N-acetyl-anhydromuramyl-L-alanine amidase AmpD